MPSYLPREWGESGALRVSDQVSGTGGRTPVRTKANAELQKWLREQDAKEIVDVGARHLRELNMQRAAASRHVRLSRVS